MSQHNIVKVVATLPVTLAPNTTYYVRVGTGFSVYVTDSTGAIAHPLNAPLVVSSQTFFAEESGAVNANTNGGFQWSAGNGDETPQNSGCVALMSGTIKTLGLEVEGSGAQFTVEVYIDGVATGMTVTTAAGTSETSDVDIPVAKGQLVNFRTITSIGSATSGRVNALLLGSLPATGEVIAPGATDMQIPVFNEATGEYEPSDLPTGTDEGEVGAIAAGSTLGLQQELLANAGQPGLTVLAVGFTTSGKVQGNSLGDGNVVTVYANGDDFNNGIPIWETTAGQAAGYTGPEFMALGEPICFTGLDTGAIVTSTQGFYGFSEQVDGADMSPMPLLSYGLSFKSTFFFGFRNCNAYLPGLPGGNQGWVHVVNGPLVNTIRLANGAGVTVQGQEGIKLAPWQYHRLYTSGNQEYLLEGDNPMMACHAANMDLQPFGRFYDSRLVMPLTNDGITWPRSGQVSAPFDNTQVAWFTRDNAQGFLNSGNIPGGVSPGSPVDFDAAPPTGTGATDTDYEPNGATRLLATGLVSAYSGADSAGLEASPLMPTSAMSQVVAQPLFIADNGDGGNSGVAIASPYAGTAWVYEWNDATGTLELAYTVPLNRFNVTVNTKEDQKHPSAGLVANETVNGSVSLAGQLNPGVVIANVPITVVVQNGVSTLAPTLRSQNGSTTSAIRSNDDETLSLGITPAQIAAEVREGADSILYRREIGAGGIDTWPEA